MSRHQDLQPLLCKLRSFRLLPFEITTPSRPSTAACRSLLDLCYKLIDKHHDFDPEQHSRIKNKEVQ